MAMQVEAYLSRYCSSEIDLGCLWGQVVSGFSTPHTLVPTSTKLLNGHLDSVSGYAKAAAVQGGKHLKGLGEAGYKFVSSQYGQWRSGSWEGATSRCSSLPI
jgi:hypothetical protein